jgi:hypothetical protein
MNKLTSFIKFIWSRYILGSKIKYTWEVKKFTFYGDSTAYQMGDRMSRWYGNTLVSNFAINGSILNLWLRYKDYVKRENIIILVGGNNLVSGETVSNTFYMYTEFLNRIIKMNHKGKILCVGPAPMYGSTIEENFKMFNENIKNYVKKIDINEKKIIYVPTDDIYSPGDLPDGIHHGDNYDRKIISRIYNIVKS